ncbi:uncharacterized protein LOC125501169 [Athalia rosae]|uniref:uncharacterized protein LOC125501169 n=1 Tax=Athalia rosae TaxID=37344 RepID=UPI002033DD76|nr:uncharacterized protein LOC125501169 [Athalia rosae]
MKNEHSLSVQAVKFGGCEYSFSNTCDFDSVLTTVLVDTCDHPDVERNMISRKKDVPLFELILSIMQKGLRAHAYRQRAVILKDLYRHSIKQTNANSYKIDCRVNACYLVTLLFTDAPSVEEVSICEGGCPPRRKKLRIIGIQRKVLHDPSFEDLLTEHVAITDKRKCCRKGCSSNETTNFPNTGNFHKFSFDFILPSLKTS